MTKMIEETMADLKEQVDALESAPATTKPVSPAPAAPRPPKGQGGGWRGIGLARLRQQAGDEVRRRRELPVTGDPRRGRCRWAGMGVMKARAEAAAYTKRLAAERTDELKQATAYAARTHNGRVPSIFSW